MAAVLLQSSESRSGVDPASPSARVALIRFWQPLGLRSPASERKSASVPGSGRASRFYCVVCRKSAAASAWPAPVKVRPDRDLWALLGICGICGSQLMKLARAQPTPHPSLDGVHPLIPIPAASDLLEAKTCRRVAAFHGCASMLRRALETAAIDRGGTGRTLAAKLRSLQNSGQLGRPGQEWGQLVREVGNRAAHPSESPLTAAEVDEVLVLTEQLLHQIYVGPALRDRWRSTRGAGR
jgi:uncharacterized protein DUF4145